MTHAPSPDEPPPYPVAAGPVDAEIVINRSRFISWLRPVADRTALQDMLAKAAATYPDANHHCYAYRIGSPSSGAAGMSDDGEPVGTAGKPIFTVLSHKGVGDVAVIVTRYFGGIKLGAGGLVRAYMAAAEEVLSRMDVIERVPTTTVVLDLSFAAEQAVRHWCQGHDAAVVDVRYGQVVTMTLSVPVPAVAQLSSWCAASGVTIR